MANVTGVKARVVHVITRLSLGGSSESTVAQVEMLARAGYDVTLAVGLAESEAASIDDARRRGCRLVDVPSLGREARPRRDLAALVELMRLFRRTRPAIVHTHTSKAGFLGRLAARLCGVPAIVHQPHGHIFYAYWGPWRTGVYLALERLAARWTDRLVTLTDRGAAEHRARGIGRAGQFFTVPSGVPTDRLRAEAPSREEARRALGLDAAAFVVTGVGRLVPVKGFDLLVDALPALVAAVPETHVVLVGDGPERAALERRAGSYGLAARLHLLGARSDIARCLRATDVLAAPSRNEGMGRALVEAMALGLPVVAAAVGGIPDVIVDGESGRLVPPDDVNALAAALADLGRDRACAHALGAAGVKRAEQFSIAVGEVRLLELYAGLVREKALA
jgi:glycosyltransferase involved in cell wall biosynthesis